MNRRSFIKNISIVTAGLLTPFNCFSNNIDPEILEVYKTVINNIKEYETASNIWFHNWDIINKSYYQLLNISSYKQYKTGQMIQSFDCRDYDGYMLTNNPFLYGLFDKHNIKEPLYINKEYISGKYDQIYVIFNRKFIKLDEKQYDCKLKIDFGKFNIKTKKDYYNLKDSTLDDIRKTKYYNPILTYNL